MQEHTTSGLGKEAVVHSPGQPSILHPLRLGWQDSTSAHGLKDGMVFHNPPAQAHAEETHIPVHKCRIGTIKNIHVDVIAVRDKFLVPMGYKKFHSTAKMGKDQGGYEDLRLHRVVLQAGTQTWLLMEIESVHNEIYLRLSVR